MSQSTRPPTESAPEGSQGGLSTGAGSQGQGQGSPPPDEADLGGEITLGSALFTLVEPHRGHEVAYHRWYERDHFYAGCMIGPWFLAGRRWVATRDLKDLRIGADSDAGASVEPLFGDDRAGSYLALYWVIAGRFRENTDWGTRQVHWLHRNGRMFPERDHIHTLLYIYQGADRRDPDGVPPELALDHPFQGLAAVVVDQPEDAPDGTPPPHWSMAADSPVSLVLSFRGIPLPPDAPVTQPGTDGVEGRELQLWFADSPPHEWWGDVESYAAGEARVRWAAPFIPTIPGTDRYTDELW